jgi:hypothetical protein|tara:strand:- start:492 stop:1004 length:513 start_codon:yes stop_codon:yes gene_type:complete
MAAGTLPYPLARWWTEFGSGDVIGASLRPGQVVAIIRRDLSSPDAQTPFAVVTYRSRHGDRGSMQQWGLDHPEAEGGRPIPFDMLPWSQGTVDETMPFRTYPAARKYQKRVCPDDDAAHRFRSDPRYLTPKDVKETIDLSAPAIDQEPAEDTWGSDSEFARRRRALLNQN